MYDPKEICKKKQRTPLILKCGGLATFTDHSVERQQREAATSEAENKKRRFQNKTTRVARHSAYHPKKVFSR